MTDDVQSLEIEHKWEMDIFEDQHQRNSKSARQECEKNLLAEKRNKILSKAAKTRSTILKLK